MDRLQKRHIMTLVSAALWIPLASSSKHDVCNWRGFSATCKGNEVIQMEEAYYGRMAVGSCIRNDSGYTIGCKENVISYLDFLCSGRQSCNISLPDKHLATGHQPCPSLESYLHLQYSCTPVYTSPIPCARAPLPVQGLTGLLANTITGLNRQGSMDCPWNIRGSPGQKIRLTLHDYGVWEPPDPQGIGATDRETGAPSRDRSGICHIYARVNDGAARRSIKLCGGEAREKVAYVSLTEDVQIAITNPKQSQQSVYFVLQFEIVGCPIYKPPEGAVIAKQEQGEISVKCSATGRAWRVSCDGTRWAADGDVANCTESGQSSMSIGALFEGFLTLPQGVWIAIIISIAVLIAVVILVIGLSCLRRKRAVLIASEPKPGMYAEKYTSQPGNIPKDHYPMLTENQGLIFREREYTTTADRRQTVPPAAVAPGLDYELHPFQHSKSFSNAGNCPFHGTLSNEFNQRDSSHTTFRPHPEHIYESPKFLRRARSESDTSAPFYHELDPDHIDFPAGRLREDTDAHSSSANAECHITGSSS